MAKIITFFNHKGGVGKTTLAYNVAWNLAEQGKKVLMVDADSQANLTEAVVEEEYLYGSEEVTLFSEHEKYNPQFFTDNNVYRFFQPYIQPTLNTEKPHIEFFVKEKNLNLSLLSGAIEFAELEDTIALALSNIPGLGQVPNAVYEAFQDLSNGFDYLLVDLSPALSATNQLFLYLSDYFIVPVNPTIFSLKALKNLNQIFRDWNRKVSGFAPFNKKAKKLPMMLGIVCQNYRPYSHENEKNTTSAERFENMLAKLNENAITLALDLSGFSMSLTKDEFEEKFEKSQPYRIANIPDLNQLARISESEHIPVVALDNKILNKNRISTPSYIQKVQDFQSECQLIVDGLLKL